MYESLVIMNKVWNYCSGRNKHEYTSNKSHEHRMVILKILLNCNHVSDTEDTKYGCTQIIVGWVYLRAIATSYLPTRLQSLSGYALIVPEWFCRPNHHRGAANLHHQDKSTNSLLELFLFVQSKCTQIPIKISRKIFIFAKRKFTQKMYLRWKAQICNIITQLLIEKKLGHFKTGFSFRYRE